MADRISSGSSASTSSSSSSSPQSVLQSRTSETVIRLPSLKGFAFDLSPSREDPLARRAAEHVFGKVYVDECFSRLHRSTLSYDALVSDLFGYERPHPRRPFGDGIYAMALESVRQDLRVDRKLVPHTIGAVPKLPDFPRQKSPGLPFKNMGYKTKGEVVDDPERLKEINVQWQHIGAGIRHDPIPDVCLFARSQVCDVNKEKVRSVWGYPLMMYIEEARFFYPLMEHLKSRDCKFPVGYGCEMSKGGMAAIADLALRVPQGKFLMTDWSKFDKSIPPWLIRDAFSILAELYDFDHVVDSENLVWHVRGNRSRRRWKKIIDYFIETPVRTCTGERFLVKAGVPSGSCFTNVIDTIINCIVTRYVSYNVCGSFPDGEIYLGDDGVCVFSSSTPLDLYGMADLAHEKFGLVLNLDKSYTTSNIENIHFLGYHNRPVGLPNRDQALLVVSFVHPERSRRTAVECAAAALGQLWANFDPKIAVLWYRILVFVSDAFLVSFDDTLVQLRKTAHRHKYLYHIGRNVDKITIPAPGDFNAILEVLPAPVPDKALPIRRYAYGGLYAEAYSFWSKPPEHED